MVGLCRLCASLRKMDVLIAIKSDSNEICEKLRKCCQLNIKMCDDLPKYICEDCLENLNNSHKFYTKVKDAQEILKTLYPFTRPKEEIVKVNSATCPSQVGSSEVCKKGTEQRLNSKLSEYIFQQGKLGRKDNTNNTTELIQIKKDVMHEVYELELAKDERQAVCESPFEIVQNNDDNNQSQLKHDHQNLNNNRTHNFSVVLKGNDLASDEVVKERNDSVPDSEINIEVEHVEYYVEELEDDEALNENDVGENNYFTHLTDQLYLDSWKDYKFLCFICDNISSNFIDLKNHITQEHNIPQIDKFQYKCYDCKKIISRYNFFLNHVRAKHHRELKLKCDVCDLSCQNFQELSYHRSFDCAEARNYAHTMACDECFKSFRNIYGLQNHIKIQHNSSKAKVKYKCTQCSKEFQYKSCLRSHEHVHSDTKKVLCNFCDKSFHNKFNLEQHLYVHINEKAYQCNICNKTYKTFQTLDEHQKLHTNEKTFQCEFCDKSFYQKIQKITHERCHTGEKPYTCDHCDKRFRYRSALFVHSKIHTGYRPYSCEYCPKSFADSSNRNKHVKRMHLNCERKENKVK